MTKSDTRLADIFQKAVKIVNWPGPVYVPRAYENGYFESIEALRETYEAHGQGLPQWVFPCNEVGLKLHAEHILENALSDWEDDSQGDFDVSGLQKILDDWCAMQKPRAWVEDTKRVVLIAP